jgi:hypothetical protein
MADCKKYAECGCAFWRPSDHSETGWCALSNVECSAPTIGAMVDYTRIRTAIVKCGYDANATVEDSWPDETYDGMSLLFSW